MPGTGIAKVETARRAVAAALHDLAEAKSVPQVTKIRSQAEGIRAYAKAAKDRTLETDAAEIHFRATRRVGEMIAAQKATVGLAKGTAGKGRPKKGGRLMGRGAIPTLADVGVDKHLAHEARTLAAPSKDTFEKLIAEWRKQAEASNEPVTINLLKAIRKAAKGEQLSLFDVYEFYLSGAGRKLERAHRENAYAPDWLKLADISDQIIEIIAGGMRKLEKLAARIAQPGGPAKFQKEFDRMEISVTKLVEQHRRLKKLIVQLQSAGVSVEPKLEPEYDPELERRGLWPPDNSETDDMSDDDIPF